MYNVYCYLSISRGKPGLFPLHVLKLGEMASAVVAGGGGGGYKSGEIPELVFISQNFFGSFK